MRAILVSELGGPEQLKPAELPDPSPGPGELLVEVGAAGLNFIDTYHRSGLYPIDLPFVPGLEGAGTVVEVGTGVEGLSVGSRVAWAGQLGSYAELIVVAADRAVPVPDGVGLGQAAAVMLQGLTAHYLATSTHALARGERCLIHAGAGGVGLLLTQIAKMRGAEVATTVGSEDKATLSQEAGADHVVVYTEEDFVSAIESTWGPHAVDVVYDGVGAATFTQGLEVLRPRGLMVTFGNASGPVPEIAPLVLARKGSLFLTRPLLADYTRTREELLTRCSDLFGWIESGDLRVTIGAEFSLDEAADAHRDLEGRRTTGKVLILP